MADKKRKDKKGRLLLDGESQRTDGRYEYRYTDNNGKRRSVYSYRLTATDKLPEECRAKNTEPLRDMEARIKRDMQDDIDTYTAKTMTLDKAFEKNMKTRRLKESTRENYTYMYEKYVSPEFGNLPIDLIKYTDLKGFYARLINNGFKANSIETIQTIISPVFKDAVKDGVIRLNPTQDLICDLKKTINWVKAHRSALTMSQQVKLLEFVKDHPIFQRWYSILVFFLGTGCRASEGIGIRWDDIDFKNNVISINHNTLYHKRYATGQCEVYITSPKTESGVRIIPLLPEVRAALEREREYQQQYYISCQDVIDGYTNFVFCNRYGHVHRPMTINKAIDRIVATCNNKEMIDATNEGREPILLPDFSLHNLRHTFCTRLCENENNIKVIQEIMGHADSQTTLDIYAEVTREAKDKFFTNIASKISITGGTDHLAGGDIETDHKTDAN